jgi:hypothetical protein
MKQMQQLILQCVTFCNICILGKLYEISAQVELLYPKIEGISKFYEFFFQKYVINIITDTERNLVRI